MIQLDFTGKVVKKRGRQPRLKPAGRLLGTCWQVLGSDPRPVRHDLLAYNEIGQVTRKTLACGALLQ